MKPQFRIWVAVVSLALGVGVRAADLPDRQLTLNIQAQPMEDALNQFAQQSGLQVLISSDDAPKAMRAPSVVGSFTVDAALKQLLAESGLRYEFVNARTVAIRSAKRAEGASKPTANVAGNGVMRIAQADASQGAQQNSNANQESSGGSESSSGAHMEEIVVTATKRAERAQDVPLSIAVIGNQEIERRGLIGMEDYLRSIPGVNQIDRGGADNAIVIRGITTSPQNENTASGATVATYFDETPITGAGGQSSANIDLRPVDIERIEVLRGPQGTAFGSASLGGAVRIIAAKPKLDALGGKVAGAYSNTGARGGDNSMVQGVLNAPLVKDRLALRAVGYHYDDSGFYRNIAGNDPATIARAVSWNIGSDVSGFVQDDVGRMVTNGGRIAVLWQATDKLDLTATFVTQKIEQDGLPFAEVGTYDQITVPIDPASMRLRGTRSEAYDTSINLSSLVANYDFGWAALTSSFSYVESGSAQAQDIAGALGNYPSNSLTDSDFESFTAETRLASNLSGPLSFLVGVFYEDVDEHRLQTVRSPSPTAVNPFTIDPIHSGDLIRQLDDYAAFGELTYQVTPEFAATVGARYYNYDKTEITLREGALYGLPLGAGVPVAAQKDEGDTLFKANLTYKPVEEAMLYASFSQGFRLGRPTTGVPPSVCDRDNDGLVDNTNITVESTRSINSDTLDNYEIGAKFSLFDRRMTVDASSYHIDWNGLPISVVAPAPCNFGYTANAGAATSDGAELQASVFVTKGLRVDFGSAYTRARLSKDAPRLGAVKGDRLPGSPKVSANLAVQYDFDVMGYKTFVRADSLYAGDFYGDLLQTAGLRAGDYIKVDARAGVELGNLSVELFVRNLTNEDAFTWRGTTLAGTLPFIGYRLRPRTAGIQLGYNFK